MIRSPIPSSSRRGALLALLLLPGLAALLPAPPARAAGETPAQKAAAEAAKKAAEAAKKAAEQARKQAEKRFAEEYERQKREAERLKKAAKAKAPAKTTRTTLPPGLLQQFARRQGDIDPSGMPILDTDFLPGPDAKAATLDPRTWMQVRGPEAHSLVSGAGVLVAVLDGGFNLRHPVISARLAPFGRDVLDGDDDPNDPGNGVDDDLDGIVDRAVGHGTFVAGMVLLAAPDATILPVRVCNDEGRSGPLDWWGLGGGLGGSLNGDAPLFRGILFALAAGARVINLSTKDAEDSVDVAFAIAEAEARGVTVVVSAGNDGLPLWKDVPGTVVVGAVDAMDVRADFTSFAAGWGTLGDRFLFAPGVDLHGAFGGYFDESIAWWSGTSFAAGIVSGAAALYLSAWGPVEPAWVARVLLSGADPVPGEAARRLDLWRMLWS